MNANGSNGAGHGPNWMEPWSWFSRIMARKLQQNEHKGTWRGDSVHLLAARVLDEFGEFLAELRHPGRHPSDAFVLAQHFVECASMQLRSISILLEPQPMPGAVFEAADMANFSMMLADIARRTPP